LAAFVTVVFFGVIVAAGIVVGGPVATAIVAIAVQPLRARVHGLTAKVAHRESELVIKTLGGFEVRRRGTPVEWKSKKSRTLLKILVARRGRPVPRERLMEWLWPGEDPAKLANRLSVALTTLRAALGRELDVIRTDAGAVALDLTQVEVDVERFLERPAEHLYTGDFLEEDVYEDWAGDLRDEARAAYAATLRARAERARDAEAIRACLRLLELDPYDAGAHRVLIARLDGSGRHGEAIERRRTYIRTMHEIGVHAAL
jgi:two-component SAPR family response regulator